MQLKFLDHESKCKEPTLQISVEEIQILGWIQRQVDIILIKLKNRVQREEPTKTSTVTCIPELMSEHMTDKKKTFCGILVAILGCHLDYIQNELQFRIGGLTCDPDLEARSQVSDLDLDVETSGSGHENLRPQGSTHL